MLLREREREPFLVECPDPVRNKLPPVVGAVTPVTAAWKPHFMASEQKFVSFCLEDWGGGEEGLFKKQTPQFLKAKKLKSFTVGFPNSFKSGNEG